MANGGISIMVKTEPEGADCTVYRGADVLGHVNPTPGGIVVSRSYDGLRRRRKGEHVGSQWMGIRQHYLWSDRRADRRHRRYLDCKCHVVRLNHPRLVATEAGPTVRRNHDGEADC